MADQLKKHKKSYGTQIKSKFASKASSNFKRTPGKTSKVAKNTNKFTRKTKPAFKIKKKAKPKDFDESPNSTSNEPMPGSPKDEDWSEDDEEGYDGPSAPVKWYEQIPDPNIPEDEENSVLNINVRKEAGSFFNEALLSAEKAPKTIPKSDYKWMKKVMKSGTLNDKIAAYVLLIQEDPIANFNHIKYLTSMVKVEKKRECFLAIDTLVQLFLEDLLPPDRKLKAFNRQPVSHVDKISKNDRNLRKQILLTWFFEDQLKQQYAAFINALGNAAHDSVESNKGNVITAMCKLLQGHSEQEAVLLSKIVNKLGDPSHKVGSKVIHVLNKLLDVHPAMKGVVMEEVERVIFRPNMNRRAQYYSVCFLTQFTFSASEAKMAASLISIYFSLFKACIKTGDIDSRMMSALLTGVSRAYPYAKNECSSLSEHINTIYKVVHLSGTNVAIHALNLLFLIEGDLSSNRFMRVLYKKIGERSMYTAAHHAIFLNLIFKAMKLDTDDGRVCAFVKRLLQVASHLPVPVICGILILISELIHIKKEFSLPLVVQSDVVVKFEETDDNDEHEHYVDQDLNVTVKIEDESDEKPPLQSSSWYHAGQKSSSISKPSVGYNPYERDPRFAAGDKAAVVELLPLSRHFHPTVALFAQNIIDGVKIKYTGDPLQDFSLIRFLDKFVFKNPKKIDDGEKLGTFAKFDRKKYYASVGIKGIRANTKEYLVQDEKNIPVDETFLFRYLRMKEKDESDEKRKKVGDDDSDAESLDEDEFKAIMRGMGGVPKDDFDFMKEMKTLPPPKKAGPGKKGVIENEDSDDDEEDDLKDLEDDDDMEDGSDLDIEDDDLSEDGSFDDAQGDDNPFIDESDMEDEGDELPSHMQKKKKSKTIPEKNRKKGTENFFAAAEEFAELLEADSYKAGSSSALSNRDNAGVRQLEWEVKRDQWLKGNKFKKSGKLAGFKSLNRKRKGADRKEHGRSKKKKY